MAPICFQIDFCWFSFYSRWFCLRTDWKSDHTVKVSFYPAKQPSLLHLCLLTFHILHFIVGFLESAPHSRRISSQLFWRLPRLCEAFRSGLWSAAPCGVISVFGFRGHSHVSASSLSGLAGPLFSAHWTHVYVKLTVGAVTKTLYWLLHVRFCCRFAPQASTHQLWTPFENETAPTIAQMCHRDQ